MEQPMHQTQMTMPQAHHQTTAAIHPTTAMHMSAAAAAAAAAAATNGGATGGPPQNAAAAAHHHHFLSSPALASPAGSANNAAATLNPANPPIAANAPCSTLFVANLGQFVSEHELKEVFSSMPGFCRLRMHTKAAGTITTNGATCNANAATAATTTTAAGAATTSSNLQQLSNATHPVAFIEFNDAATAAQAMQQLQGKYLLSSDRGSIRIEFAKTKMINDAPATIINAIKHQHNNNSNMQAIAMKSTAATVNIAATQMPPTLAIINQPQTSVTTAGTPHLVILNGYAAAANTQHQHQPQQLAATLFNGNNIAAGLNLNNTVNTVAATNANVNVNVNGNANTANVVHNNLVNNRSTAQLPPPPIIPPPPLLQNTNSLQHQLHPTQHHQNHLFRDVCIIRQEERVWNQGMIY